MKKETKLFQVKNVDASKVEAYKLHCKERGFEQRILLEKWLAKF